MTEPEECRTMTEVRIGVDALDRNIVTLLAKRFRFMDAAARIKQNREAVRDEARKAEVIRNVTGLAKDAGGSAEVIAELYEKLVEASIGYELERFDERSGA